MFARIQSGTVAELFTPPNSVSIGECFVSSLTWVDVTNVSPPPQPGWLATQTGGAWSFAAPTTPAPSAAQQAATLQAIGLAITSTGTPAMNGTYPCDTLTQSHLQAEMLAILVTGAFADGASSVVWPDNAGSNHTIPSVTAFKAFALAIAAFVAACAKVTNGSTTTLPTATATIP